MHELFAIGEALGFLVAAALERRGLITSLWRQTEKNRVARFYELTTTGRQILRSRTESWRDYAAAIDRVLSAD